jgi:hypothetical protein
MRLRARFTRFDNREEGRSCAALEAYQKYVSDARPAHCLETMNFNSKASLSVDAFASFPFTASSELTGLVAGIQYTKVNETSAHHQMNIIHISPAFYDAGSTRDLQLF